MLGLVNSYHGDTLGAMDCAAPSVFNGILEQPWYTGRGMFLEPPTVGLADGQWRLQLPHALSNTALAEVPQMAWDSRDDVFSSDRDMCPLAQAYRDFVLESIDRHERHSNARIGALIMEPVLQGAGGMVLVDPLFQRVAATECRARGIPVIFDEVFTGCWRLGTPSAAHMLAVQPDLACYAKLLTAGALPMAVTLSTSEVFDQFHGPSKVHALLHGHSYTAHPIGCHTAAVVLRMYRDPEVNPNYCTPGPAGTCPRQPQCSASCGNMVEYWDEAPVRDISKLDNVARVVALGTVLAVELQPAQGVQGGYTSNVTRGVVQRLAEEGIYTRPLGSVVYLMCTPLTPPDKRAWLLVTLRECIYAELVSSMMCP